MAISISVLFIPFDAAVSHKTRNAGRGVDGRRVTPGPSMPDPEDNAYTVGTERIRVEAIGVPMSNAAHAPLSAIVSDACRQAVDARAPTPEHPYVGTPAYNAAMATLFEERMRRRRASRCPDLIFLSEEPKGVSFDASFQVTLDGVPVMYERFGVAGDIPVQRIAAYRRSGHVGFWQAQPETKKYEWDTKKHQEATENILVARYEYDSEWCKIAGVHLTSKNTAARPGTANHARILSELEEYCVMGGISLAIGDFNASVRDHDGGTVGAVPHSTKLRNRVRCAACKGTTWRADGACAACNRKKLEPALVNNEPEWIEQYSNSVNTAHYMGLVAFGTNVFTQQSLALSLQRSLGGAYFSDHPPIYAEIQVGEHR